MRNRNSIKKEGGGGERRKKGERCFTLRDDFSINCRQNAV